MQPAESASNHVLAHAGAAIESAQPETLASRKAKAHGVKYRVRPCKAVLLAPHTAAAQQPGKVARVGYLATVVPDCSASPPCQAMAQRLQELGYVEGQNLRIEFRTAAAIVWKCGRRRQPRTSHSLFRLQCESVRGAVVCNPDNEPSCLQLDPARATSVDSRCIQSLVARFAPPTQSAS